MGKETWELVIFCLLFLFFTNLEVIAQIEEENLPLEDKSLCEIPDNLDSIIEKLEVLLEEFEKKKKDYSGNENYYGPKNDEDEREGFGLLKFPNGDYHIGEWKKNLRHGIGKTFLNETKEVYLGEWRFDNQHGLGKLTTVDGRYEGEWRVSRQNGCGNYVWTNSEYFGEWKDGFPHGFGLWQNDQIFHKGFFFKGQREGEGIITRKIDGAVLFRGHFHQDKPIE